MNRSGTILRRILMIGHNIRPMTSDDKNEVLAMMRVFFDSPVVLHNTSDTALERAFDDCTGQCPHISGYVLENNGEAAGYAMISFSYTTEYGGICIWLEDLYLKPQFRRQGFAGELFRRIETDHPEAVRFKLEIEEDNTGAAECYRRNGYSLSGYRIMTKEMIED